MSATSPIVQAAPAQPANLFGQIITAGMVERAMVASLQQWMPDYLGQMERIETDSTGELAYRPDAIEPPRGIITRSDFDKWPEDQVPVIVVMCTGLAGQPERHANGNYWAPWAVGVAAIVSDTDEDSTRRLAQAYGAAMRTAVLQHKMLKSPLYPAGFANGTSWTDEQYTDMPPVAERTMQAARVTFSVGVDDVTTEYAGPRTPSGAPSKDPGNWPTVKSADATVTPIGFEEPFTS